LNFPYLSRRLLLCTAERAPELQIQIKFRIEVDEAEPVFVNLLRSPGIDFRPGGPVRRPYLSYWPARLHSLAESIPRNQFLGSLNVYKYGLCPMILIISGYPGPRFYALQYSAGLTLSFIYIFVLNVFIAGFSPLSPIRYKIKANNSATSAVNCYVRKFLQKYLEKLYRAGSVF
jgi:hypothetical protein